MFVVIKINQQENRGNPMKKFESFWAGAKCLNGHVNAGEDIGVEAGAICKECGAPLMPKNPASGEGSGDKKPRATGQRFKFNAGVKV